MDINNELAQKLINSNNHIDNILNSIVNVKFICKINDRYLMDKDTMSLPSINVTKGLLNNNYILSLINEELNISVTSIKAIPFSYYNNYDERYYIIDADVSQIDTLDSGYIFETVSNIKGINEHDIIIKAGEYKWNF